MSMGKLYAITEGEYSDYHIIGLCSDKARAEEICEQYNAKTTYYYEAKIEEFYDGAAIDVTIPVYEVRLFIKTGEVNEVSELSPEDAIEHHLGTYIFSDGPIHWDNSIYRCFVATPLEDTAIKIARDRLAQYKYSLAEQNKKIFENF